MNSVADAVAQAAVIPDQRDRPVAVPPVTHSSPEGEVEVTVDDMALTALHVDATWLRQATPQDVQRVLVTTVNGALAEWTDLQLQTVQNITPDMKQLHAAISTARQKLQDSWVAALVEGSKP